MNRTILRRPSLLAGLFALSASLGACTTTNTFTADVDNQTGQPVRAWLATPGPNPDKQTSPIRIGPRDRGTVALTATTKTVNLEVDIPGNAGVPKRVSIDPGRAIVKVSQESPTSRTKINLTVVENY